MSTPEVLSLSKKQQNKTLSAKKKPLKTIRNVLSSKNTEWPLLEDPTVLSELKKLIIHKPNESVSESFLDCVEKKLDKDNIKKHLLFGINEIAKCISKNKISALLIDAEVPRILVSHLLIAASMKNIPTACIPNLATFLADTFNIRSSSVCIKRESSDQLEKVIDLIKNKGSEVESAQKMNIDDEKKTYDNVDSALKSTSSKIVYLYRYNKKQRIFNPSASSKLSKNETITDFSPQYIKLPSEPILKENNSIKKKDHILKKFNPPLIKRIQNNVNRVKKIRK